MPKTQWKTKTTFFLFVVSNPFNSFSTQWDLFWAPMSPLNILIFPIVIYLIGFIFAIFLDVIVAIGRSCRCLEDVGAKKIAWLHEMMSAHPHLDTEVSDNEAASSVVQLCEEARQRTGKYVEYSDGLQSIRFSAHGSDRSYDKTFDTFFIRLYDTPPTNAPSNQPPVATHAIPFDASSRETVTTVNAGVAYYSLV